MRRHSWLGSLGWRLFAAFLAVAVAALALLTAVAAVSVDQRSARLADQQREQFRADVAAALAAAYQAGRQSWSAADLAVVAALARSEGVDILVLDKDQGVVTRVGPAVPSGTSVPTGAVNPSTPAHTQHATSTPMPTGSRVQSQTRTGTRQQQPEASTTAGYSQPPRTGGSPQQSGHSGEPHHNLAAAWQTPTPSPTTTAATAATVPVVVDGVTVGSARLVFPAHTPEPVAAARAALMRSLAIGSALAALVAAAGAAFVTRRLSRPLVALADATRAFAAGDPHPETLVRRAPGELGQVAHAFVDMADTVRKQDELRREFIADVAHELRTPVTILRGQTEMLLDGVAEPSAERLVSLHDEVLRLARLTDDLAAMSAADAAGLSLRRERVDLASVTQQAVTAMKAEFDDANVQVSLVIDEQIMVNGDPGRLTQVITNLLTNAAKFTPAGGSVSVTVARSGTQAVVAVEDSGPGIPEDELVHVFERFWRGRAAGARSGSGVGLAVVQALVTAHGGSVSVVSPPGHGARFTFRIPADAE